MVPNRLADATSPYLLQHRDNPVEWWEWAPEPFDEARARDVPVLVSIGYAACHWCHVMAHESFEDPGTASVMNRLFVNVKVDREERPDVDSVYMEAVQAMTGQGGWPMTVFVDHDGRPFFAGTYFPQAPRHGMPSFRDVMEAVSDAWRQRREEVAEQATRLVEAIETRLPPPSAPDPGVLETAFSRIGDAFDPVNGGLGKAPKFPQQPVLEYVLGVRGRSWAAGADGMLATTLEKMARGGIHDHLGGGFARYSVDDRWVVPHFEKMLYDNAQLARLYLWAGIELGRPEFIDVSKRTLAYMSRDLAHPDGGFYSSEDADSEGVEGKFYVWSMAEVAAVDAVLVDYFALTERGNFEGANILTVPEGDLSDHAEPRARLFERRTTRVRPGLDDKIVTAWNGLTIRAFAESGAALDEPELVDTARRAGHFASENLLVDGRLRRSWRQGKAPVPGFLEDHAALALGFFSLFATTAEEHWYEQAIHLVDELTRFARVEGGFHTTPEDGETLVKRPFDVTDNPTPSGNALAAEALLIASLYTGGGELRTRADEAIAAVGELMPRYPTMVAHHLSVLDRSTRAKELAIVGSDWRSLADAHYRRFRPHVVLAPSATGTATVPLLDGRRSDNGAVAYLCEGFVCDLPTSDPGTLATLLGP
jgi:uncharacterized protein YyaL (SSP411 family)